MAWHSKNLMHGVNNLLDSWEDVQVLSAYTWRIRPVLASNYNTILSGVTPYQFSGGPGWWTKPNSGAVLTYDQTSHGVIQITATSNIGNVAGIEMSVQKTLNSNPDTGFAAWAEAVFARGYFSSAINLQNNQKIEITSLTMSFYQGDYV